MSASIAGWLVLAAALGGLVSARAVVWFQRSPAALAASDDDQVWRAMAKRLLAQASDQDEEQVWRGWSNVSRCGVDDLEKQLARSDQNVQNLEARSGPLTGSLSSGRRWPEARLLPLPVVLAARRVGAAIVASPALRRAAGLAETAHGIREPVPRSGRRRQRGSRRAGAVVLWGISTAP